MNLALKKGKSLEDSLSGHSAQVEDGRSIEVVGGFSGLFEQYREFLEKDFQSGFNPNARNITFAQVRTVLDPSEINAFLQSTVVSEDHPNYCKNTAIFLSGLIQASYEAGNEFFDLNVESLKLLEGLGVFLCKSEDYPYSVRVKGNVGNYLGINSGSVKFSLDGDTGRYCGSISNGSQFYVSGNGGQMTCFGSKDCLFDFRGNVEGLYLVNANESTILFSDRKSFERTREKYTEEYGAALERNEVYFVRPDKRKELLVIPK